MTKLLAAPAAFLAALSAGAIAAEAAMQHIAPEVPDLSTLPLPADAAAAGEANSARHSEPEQTEATIDGEAVSLESHDLDIGEKTRIRTMIKAPAELPAD